LEQEGVLARFFKIRLASFRLDTSQLGQVLSFRKAYRVLDLATECRYLLNSSTVTIPFPSPDNHELAVRMSATYGEKEVRIWIMGFGLVLILIGLALMASWTQNILYLPMGWFVFILGIGAFVTGFAVARWDRPPVPKVRCRQCYTLNYETDMRCKNCRASLF